MILSYVIRVRKNILSLLFKSQENISYFDFQILEKTQ